MAGLLALSFTDADTTLALVMAPMFVLGLGLGSCMQPLLLIMQSAVPPSDIGVATSSATFFRQIGGTIGVAIFLSVLFSSVGGNIATSLAQESSTPAFQQAVGSASPGSADAELGRALQDPSASAGFLAQVQDDSSVITRLSPVLAHPFKVGFAASMDTVFLSAAGVAVLGFLILLLLPEVELRETSAQAATASTQPAPAAPRE